MMNLTDPSSVVAKSSSKDSHIQLQIILNRMTKVLEKGETWYNLIKLHLEVS